ncbi:MAG TPA: GTP diphosphokinase [Candidatus Competibacteraceae bacterium]|nr:GTP diphosphokinase [Candidatus Competibacteraceae bacterium]
MVTPTRILPSDTGFDTWLTSLPVRWNHTQSEAVRRAHAQTTDRGLAAADLLADLRMDHEVVIAALLHETVAAGTLSLKAVEDSFGPSVARLVDGVGKLSLIGDLYQQGPQAQQQLESLRKMLLAMAQDVRVVLIRLAICLVTMRNLKALPLEEQQRIARETLNIFAPLANRLGIAQMKWELEDLALRYLEPVAYKQLAQALDERRAERETYIAKVIQQLRTELQRAGLHAEVCGRAKHIYSIWRKMQRKQLPFEQIFDIRALRVMVDTVADCYAALGVVHALWNHIRHEFDNYIANPKSNGYQSLHTAVIGPEGKTLEVQIRTWDMHHHAELGVAAHWRYKEGGTQTSAYEQQIAWLRQLLEWKDDELTDACDFLDRFKAEAFQDRVYVITPKGAVIELPQGATPLDFAYHIHTDIGHRCRGAKVNRRIVPLNYELKNGDQVNVLTAKHPAPSRDWLSPHLGYLKSARARGKVRQWFKQLDQEKNIAVGKAILEKEFQRLGVDLKQVDLQKLAEKLNFTAVDELFAAIGYGDVTTGAVATKAQELILPPPPAPVSRLIRKPSGGETGEGIQIRGVGKLLTHMARCCKPVPFEPIVGFITHGRGVTIHRQDCPNLLNLATREQERMIEVAWGREQKAVYPVDIMIQAYDRTGLLRDISSILLQEKINVLATNTRTDPKTAIAHMLFTLEIGSVEQLSRILDKICRLSNVTDAHRQLPGAAPPW